MSGESFALLLERVRRRDQAAADEMIQRYGPHIRRIARINLQRSRLNGMVESADICQSVMVNFYQRAIEGQFTLETAEQLLALLSTMTRNHVLKKVAYHQAQRRDVRRLHDGDAELAMSPNSEQTPSAVVADAELVAQIHRLLTDDERFVLEQRAAGRSWVELASQLGMQVDNVRKRASRALNRVAEAMKSDVTTDGRP